MTDTAANAERSLTNLSDSRLRDVERWQFLEDPADVMARSHYARLTFQHAPFRTKLWRLPTMGHVVAVGDLYAGANSVSRGRFVRPVLWLRTSPPDPTADPYDPSYWPSEGVAVTHVLAAWPHRSAGADAR